MENISIVPFVHYRRMETAARLRSNKPDSVVRSAWDGGRRSHAFCRFGRLCRTLDGVLQRRATTLSLVAFVLVSTAFKLNLLVPFDAAAEAWVRQQITPFRTALMFTLTRLASGRFVSGMTALLAGALALRKSGYRLARLALSVPGCMLLNEVLRYLFHRTPPGIAHPLLKLQPCSFPSGHAVEATVLYGFVAILLWAYIASKVWRVLISTAIVAAILGVGFSRIYLGAHYPTDVLAGVPEGVAWLNFAAMITNRHRFATT